MENWKIGKKEKEKRSEERWKNGKMERWKNGNPRYLKHLKVSCPEIGLQKK